LQTLLDGCPARRAQARDGAGSKIFLGRVERAFRVLQKFFFLFHSYLYDLVGFAAIAA
jgi:hypothetical protein